MPYKRVTYFRELLSQWDLRAPPIPEEDEDAIFKWWDKHGRATEEQWADPILAKKLVRTILAALDAKLRKRGERPRFIRKYYEKWLTLRKHIGGYSSHSKWLTSEERNLLLYMFERAERIFEDQVKRRAGRHSFLNYNFVVRRLLEMINWRDAIVDWPPLKTQSKQRFLVKWWRAICDEANWPYVNSDRQAFPRVAFFDENE